MYLDWDLHHVSLVVCYILHLLIYLFHAGINNARNAIKLFKKVHVEWNYILQPPKYLIIAVTNRFQYINNNVIKVRCSIYIDIWPLCLLYINSACRRPYIIMDHLCILVINTTSINCCIKQHPIATTTKLRSLKWLMLQTPLLHMCDNPTRNHAELAIIASWVTQLGIISSSVVPTSNC